jgi:hypothetical protein
MQRSLLLRFYSLSAPQSRLSVTRAFSARLGMRLFASKLFCSVKEVSRSTELNFPVEISKMIFDFSVQVMFVIYLLRKK